MGWPIDDAMGLEMADAETVERCLRGTKQAMDFELHKQLAACERLLAGEVVPSRTGKTAAQERREAAARRRGRSVMITRIETRPVIALAS